MRNIKESQGSGPGSRVWSVHGEFKEFGHLADAVSDWDLSWQQIDDGPLDAHLAQVGHESAVIGRVRFNRRFLQCGSSPANSLTFAVLGEGVEGVRWCSTDVDAAMILPFPYDYEAISQPGFNSFTVSCAEEAVQRLAGRLGLESSLERATPGTALRCNPKFLRPLRTHLQAFLNGAIDRPETLQAAAFRRGLDERLPYLLLTALDSARPGHRRRPGPQGNRQAIARAARALVRESHEELPSVADLCRHTGASLRTLEYAFQECVGVSPSRYLKTVRLERVRRALLDSGPGVRVGDIANRWGFWHLGQLAADYRRRFGELPSETARASSP